MKRVIVFSFMALGLLLVVGHVTGRFVVFRNLIVMEKPMQKPSQSLPVAYRSAPVLSAEEALARQDEFIGKPLVVKGNLSLRSDSAMNSISLDYPKCFAFIPPARCVLRDVFGQKLYEQDAACYTCYDTVSLNGIPLSNLHCYHITGDAENIVCPFDRTKVYLVAGTFVVSEWGEGESKRTSVSFKQEAYSLAD